MHNTLLSVLKYLLLLGVGIGFLYLAFREQDTEKLISDLLRADYGWVTASAAACLLSHFFRALRWNMLITPLDHRPKIQNTFAAVMVGYLANQALPRLGEVSKCASLSRAEKIPADQLIGTVVTERICDTITLIFVTLLCLIFQYDHIADFIFSIAGQMAGNPNKLLYLLFAGVIVIALISAWMLLKREIVKLPTRIYKFISGVKNGLMSITRIKKRMLFLFYSIMIWSMYYISTYVCFFALESTSELGLGAALATLLFGSIGMTIPVQGGIGTYHFMVAQGLTAYSISKSNGLAYATIIHSSQVLIILVFGALSLIFLMLVSPKKQLKRENAEY